MPYAIIPMGCTWMCWALLCSNRRPLYLVCFQELWWAVSRYYGVCRVIAWLYDSLRLFQALVGPIHACVLKEIPVYTDHGLAYSANSFTWACLRFSALLPFLAKQSPAQHNTAHQSSWKQTRYRGLLLEQSIAQHIQVRPIGIIA